MFFEERSRRTRFKIMKLLLQPCPSTTPQSARGSAQDGEVSVNDTTSASFKA